MESKRPTLEIIAPTVEEAIENGLADLGLPREAVEVETLDEGSRGIFGIGSRQARIRLTVISAAGIQKGVTETTPKELSVEKKTKPEVVLVEEPPLEEAVPPGEEDPTLRVARETVSELLEKMKVHARITAQYGEADDPESRIPVLVDIRGDDLSILIGRRSETLNALQYIAGLIIGKELGHSIAVVIDVEGYRVRREAQIRQLARRMADQAVKTGRRQILEPMPANERRIIHIELRDHPDVKTESIGEEPHRKVTILPKNYLS